MAASEGDDRCRALTEDGERCERPAEGGRFCYQHDESDPTVDEEREDDPGEGGDDTDESGREDDGEGSESPQAAVMEVRESVQSIGRELIGREIEGIIGIGRNDSGWQVTVECVERPAVPDTQDILARYRIDLDSDRSVSGYRRVDRYRRADTDQDELL